MSRKVQFEFDPFELVGIDPPKKRADRNAALDDISAFVVDEVLSRVSEQMSPVQGHGRFPKLSKGYAARKEAAGRPPVPDLELSSDMLSALEVKRTRAGTLILQIVGEEGDKADGHCNHSGDSSLPLRRFIPAEGETFKRDILEGIARIADEYGD